MRRWNPRETRADRTALARDAGLGPVSLFGVLAGTLVAYGAFAVLIAVASAIATAISDDIDLPNLNWEQLGVAASLVVAAVLLLSYLFGGYVAGRMARRSGAVNGLLVLVFSLLVAVLVTVLVNLVVDNEDLILANLRNIGIPTTAEEWDEVATVGGLASLAAMLIGSVLGGVLGERWHGKLMARAMDPDVGPAAEARAAADEHQRQAEERAARSSPAYTQPPPVAEPPTAVDEPRAPVTSRWGSGGPGRAASPEPGSAAPPPPPPTPAEEAEPTKGPRITRRPETRRVPPRE